MIKFISERVMTKLGLMQAATILSIVIAMIIGILLVHHQTDDYFTPLPAYLSSIKVAIPPLIVFLISYVSAFVTGTPISDVPKAIIGFIRNIFMQSTAMMAIAMAVSFGTSFFTVHFLLTSTPPAYEKLVELLLGGNSDELSLVRTKIVEIKKTAPIFAMHATKVTEVFAERNAVNAGQKVLSGERVRTLVRSLEADTETDWVDHPLRNHALAEAYSLFGQSAANSSFTIALDSARNGDGQFRRAINLYEQVSHSSDPLAPKSLRMSARVNMGNAHYYMGDYEGALNAWRTAAYGDDGQPNLSPWSGRVPSDGVAGWEQAVRDARFS